MTRGVLQAGRLDGAEPTMDAAHVVDAVPQPWLPLDADVQFLPVIATKLPFIGGRFGALGVRPREVVQLVEASDGRLVAEGAVWAAMVVGP
jgi:hypothetical protein